MAIFGCTFKICTKLAVVRHYREIGCHFEIYRPIFTLNRLVPTIDETKVTYQITTHLNQNCDL